MKRFPYLWYFFPGSAFWISISVPTFEGMEYMFAKCFDNFEDCWAVTLPSVSDPKWKWMLPDQSAWFCLSPPSMFTPVLPAKPPPLQEDPELLWRRHMMLRWLGAQLPNWSGSNSHSEFACCVTLGSYLTSLNLAALYLFNGENKSPPKQVL